MERDRPQLVVVSVSVRCDSALREFAQRWQIPVLASSGVFDYGGVRGILRCDSLLLGKHVYKNICAFTKNAGIRPEFYHIAYLDGENSVAIISLAQLNTLLEKGYNGIAIGEYPGKRPDLPNRYMIPVTCFKEYR